MESRISKVLHETAQDFADIGLIDAQIMLEFDATCLLPAKQYP